MYEQDNIPGYSVPQPVYYDPQTVSQARSEAIKYMVFGIVSLACSELFVLGIVFGLIAKNNGSRLMNMFPNTPVHTFARAAYITGKIGFVLSIVFTAIWSVYAFVFLAMFL